MGPISATCKRCEAQLAADGSCGDPTCVSNVPTDAPPTAVLPKPLPDGRIQCPACAGKMGASTRFCVDCGVPLRASAAYQAVTHGTIPDAAVPPEMAVATPRQRVQPEHKESGVRPREDYHKANLANSKKAGNGT